MKTLNSGILFVVFVVRDLYYTTLKCFKNIALHNTEIPSLCVQKIQFLTEFKV